MIAWWRGPSSASHSPQVFEAVSVLVFTVEFGLRLFSISKDREHLYSQTFYLTTFFGVVDTLSFLPWYVQQIGIGLGLLDEDASDAAAVFRIFRLFRILQRNAKHRLTPALTAPPARTAPARAPARAPAPNMRRSR